MTLFWLLALGLSVISAIFALRPMLNKGKVSESRRSYNQAVFVDRLAELDFEKETMNLSDQEYETLKSQLKASLLDDIPDDTTTSLKSSNKSTMLVAGITLFVTVFSFGLYAVAGGQQQVEDWYSVMRNPDLSEEGLLKVLNQRTTQNTNYSVGDYLLAARTRVHENPEDPNAWLTLARTYLRAPMREAAETTLKRANNAMPNNPDILLAQAQVYQMVDGNGGRASQKLTQVLKIDPQNSNALFYQAINATQNGRYTEAVQRWKTLLTVLPGDSPMIKTAEQGLLMAEKKLASINNTAGEQLAVANNKPSTLVANKSGKREILIKASVDERFKGKYAPDDTVFLMAKMLNKGAPMPLAVIKTTVAALAKPQLMDETMAMMPDLSLAKFDQVRVIARISKSGDARAAMGDIEGSVEPVDLANGKTSHVTVKLNRVVGHSKTTSAAPKPDPSIAQAQPATASSSPKVTVNVRLKADLRAKTKDDDRVFVFARAATGPRMPLAVKTARVKDLPISVTLSDADAMNPAFRLSSAPSVKITARISRTGNAQPQPGDIEGISQEIELAQIKKPVEIELNHILP